MRICFRTFGCRLNQAETAGFEALFKANGIEIVPYGEQCDACIIHSCSVTGRAESECLRSVRSFKRGNPGTLVVLTGCAVESADEERLNTLGIDLIVPRSAKGELTERVLLALNRTYTTPASTVYPVFSTHRALLKIQDGCDFFCSYCIIPYNRGVPVSRAFNTCLDEARAFIDMGFREIVITGCNIACYNDSGRDLAELIEALAALPGIGRIRCGSLEPGTLELRMAEIIAANPQICPFLHLPLQHCDDRILERMNRRYRIDDMRRNIEKILECVPRISLGSDIITGFPGEDQAAFDNTLAFLESLPFSNLHVFPYSERKGTAAVGFSGKIPVPLRRARAAQLIAAGARKRREYASSWVGSTVEMLVEKLDDSGCACGWSAEYLPCRVRGIPPHKTSQIEGSLLRFQVSAVEEDVLTGETSGL